MGLTSVLNFIFCSSAEEQPNPIITLLKKDKVSGHTNKLPQFYLSLPLLLTILHKMMFSKSSEAGSGESSWTEIDHCIHREL